MKLGKIRRSSVKAAFFPFFNYLVVIILACGMAVGSSPSLPDFRAEHPALDANHFRRFALVTSKHPRLNVCALVIDQALLYILLEQIFDASCT